ncbi:hypothetical protein [Geoalkalibacter subterraneus]|jgi:hypothetical protein|uniref:Uncharacterized protein n=1 Tax=Geoalkalibacter subterraneus TaxID=483547 RepID=A0A0B5FTS1_9BACT|nr:hypothetical protein [Geoalkalibacter subterraneus]AJF07580.1 hypothetical protein GSUB_14900 [Geoalkalibacter subterraneus]
MAISTFNFFAVAALAAIVGVTLIVVYLNLRKVRGELDALREEFSLWRRMAAAAPVLKDQGEETSRQQAPSPEQVADAEASVSAEEAEAMRERLHGGNSLGDGKAPERYRHVATLADKGLGADEIAEVLQVSPAEAQQLVKLAEVARKKS